MRVRIYLIRHGETEYNQQGLLCGWSDPPLNQGGIRQAEGLAAYFKEIEVHAIYHSGLVRAAQTARYLSRGREIPLYEHTGLRELNFGQFEGRTMADLARERPEDYAELEADGFEFLFPDGESLYHLHQRVSQTIEQLIRRHEGETLVLVGHAGSLRSILAHLIAGDVRRHWNFKIEQGSLSCIEGDDGFYTLTKLNQRILL